MKQFKVTRKSDGMEMDAVLWDREDLGTVKKGDYLLSNARWGMVTVDEMALARDYIIRGAKPPEPPPLPFKKFRVRGLQMVRAIQFDGDKTQLPPEFKDVRLSWGDYVVEVADGQYHYVDGDVFEFLYQPT